MKNVTFKWRNNLHIFERKANTLNFNFLGSWARRTCFEV